MPASGGPRFVVDVVALPRAGVERVAEVVRGPQRIWGGGRRNSCFCRSNATDAVRIFHNALDIMDVVRRLVAEGWLITAGQLGVMSPYLRALHQPVRRLRHRRPHPPARGIQPGPQGSRLHRPRPGRLTAVPGPLLPAPQIGPKADPGRPGDLRAVPRAVRSNPMTTRMKKPEP